MGPSGVAIYLLLSIAQARDALRPDLGEILEREAQYCLRLEQAALNFVCLEDIAEKVNLTKDIKVDQSALFDTMTDGIWVRSKAGIPPRKIKRTFRYDFQFIREGSRIRETRTLLQENGKKRAERNASLKATLEILRIEWSEQRIGNYAVFEKRGERYGLKPRISVTSDFDIEKNGIRFPSRHVIEEAYLDSKGKKFVRSETAVAYSDFRFFTVTVEDITQK